MYLDKKAAINYFVAIILAVVFLLIASTAFSNIVRTTTDTAGSVTECTGFMGEKGECRMKCQEGETGFEAEDVFGCGKKLEDEERKAFDAKYEKKLKENPEELAGISRNPEENIFCCLSMEETKTKTWVAEFEEVILRVYGASVPSCQGPVAVWLRTDKYPPSNYPAGCPKVNSKICDVTCSSNCRTNGPCPADSASFVQWVLERYHFQNNNFPNVPHLDLPTAQEQATKFKAVENIIPVVDPTAKPSDFKNIKPEYEGANAIKKGDLVFFADDTGKIADVGIYTAN